MIAAANVLTDLYLSIAALIGLTILHGTLIKRAADDLLVRRLVFGLRVGMMLFAGRALIVLTGGMGFRFMVLLAAALVPLAALIVAEGLLRRHAPSWAKWVIGGGAAFFGFTAFWIGGGIDPARLVGLLIFQVVGFGVAGWMIATRDRKSLSDGENRMAVRLGFSLVLLLPLAAGDFLMVYIHLPVQVSAIGVLALCWLALSLTRAHDGHRRSYAALLLMFGASLGTAVFIGVIAGVGLKGLVVIGAVVMALVLVLAIAAALRAQSVHLVAYMAEAEGNDPLAFLLGLQAHPLVDLAVKVDGASLDDAVLARIFAARPVLAKGDFPALGATADDHMAHLFARYDATHIVDCGCFPRQLVALSMPALQTSAQAQIELCAVQRMAALMATSARRS